MTVLVVCLMLCVICVLIAFALYRKGDVKAMFKVPFLAFTLEAKDKTKPE